MKKFIMMIEFDDLERQMYYLFLFVLFFSPVSQAQVPLLFSEVKPIDITIKSNFKLINTPSQSASELGLPGLGSGMIDPKYFASPGSLSYLDGSGQLVQLPALVEPRGVYRRRLCEYKPLQVKLDQLQKQGLFEGVSKSIDFITHCRDSLRDQTEVFVEYFSYRTRAAFGVPTLLVRRANITYVDEGGRYPTISKMGILLESKKYMAKRFGAEVISLTKDEEKVPFTQSELDQTVDLSSQGSYLQKKFIMRMRVNQKFLSVVNANQMTLKDQFMSFFTPLINYSTDKNTTMLNNVFPIQYSNGSTSLVDYDFNWAVIGPGFSIKNSLPLFFTQYALSLGYSNFASYKEKRTVDEKLSDRQELTRVIQGMLQTYETSKLEEEIAKLTVAETDIYNPFPLLKNVQDSVAGLREVLNSPDLAFAFLY